MGGINGFGAFDGQSEANAAGVQGTQILPQDRLSRQTAHPCRASDAHSGANNDRERTILAFRVGSTTIFSGQN